MFLKVRKELKGVKNRTLCKNKPLTILLFLLFISFVNSAWVISNEEGIKYNLSICALFKNEAMDLKEWIKYHQRLGVDHFYLYDTGSHDTYQHILQPYINDGIVTLVHWPAELCRQCEQASNGKWALAMQIPAYENAINFVAREESEWLILLDVNENMNCEGTIKDLLTKYREYSAISCSTFFFDSWVQDNFVERNDLLTSLKIKPLPEKAVTKMIFKPSQVVGFTWPPYQCRFNSLSAVTEVTPHELHIDRFVRRNQDTEKKKSKYKKTAEQKAYSEIILNESPKNKIDDNQSNPNLKPMYHPDMPETLKKIIHNIHEIH